MKFISTRGGSQVDFAAKAISKGLANDGGLFVPENFPKISLSDLNDLCNMDYAERACFIIHKFLGEYDYNELLDACKISYSKFEENDAAPLVKLDDKCFILELFHGPTLAFKDIALTLLPYLLRKGCDLSGVKEEVLILVATSGDTGKAALEGFKDAKGIKVMVFYPSEGVSDMQKLQMCTQEGKNVNVVAIKGNFDDCQTAVKKIFTDKDISDKLLKMGVVLSSANSMNFGRLVPQVSYYFSAYADLVSSNEIKLGDKVNFVVPTGNFGNILAGYYAKQMGLPIDKLVCASNSNNVLTEFFVSGTYDANREFFKTISPSMDILISSNLERLIFELSNRDANLTKTRMEELKSSGKYSITQKELNTVSKDFFASYTDEIDCKETISEVFEEYGYVLDTHTSVAYTVWQDFISQTNNSNTTVILSTASPYKFAHDVISAIEGNAPIDAFKCANKLFEISANPIPKQISDLKQKEKRFTKVIKKSQTVDEVFEFIK